MDDGLNSGAADAAGVGDGAQGAGDVPPARQADLTVVELARALPRAPAPDLLARLRAVGVMTAAELLAAPARGDLAGLPDEDTEAVDELVAHAALATLGIAPPLRIRLVAAGLRTPADLAASSRMHLTALAGSGLEPEATQAHAAATAQTALLGALAITDRVERFSAAMPAEQDCGCDDCQAATSPIAYLADLLAYTQARLFDVDFSDAVTPSYLSWLLVQPLTELPVDCSVMRDEVSQVRLCVESLERIFEKQLHAAPDVGVVPLTRGISFVVAADVDGDRQQELVIGFDETSARPDAPVRSGIWVMRFDAFSNRWRHLRPGADPRAAALLLPAGMHVRSAFAAHLRQDSADRRAERDQLVVEIEHDGDPGGAGRRYWVLQYEPESASADGAWTHVVPGRFLDQGADLAFPLKLTGALAADVDGDGLDEIVGYGQAPPASPDGPDRPDAFWVYKLGDDGWVSLAAPDSANDVAFTCVGPVGGSSPVPARLATAGDIDGDGRQEIVALPDAPGNWGMNPWVMRYGGDPGQWAHVADPGLPLDADLLATPAAGARETRLPASPIDWWLRSSTSLLCIRSR